MRTLIVIALLQTGLLLAIFGKVVLSDDAATENRPPEPRATPSPFAPDTRSPAAIDGGMLVDEQLLRDVIRQELAAYSGAWNGGQQTPDEEEAYDPQVEAERLAKREYVEQRIEYYSSVGYISDAEMQLLKSEIARLDPDGRRIMMERLIQALNSGAIDGRLL